MARGMGEALPKKLLLDSIFQRGLVEIAIGDMHLVAAVDLHRRVLPDDPGVIDLLHFPPARVLPRVP